MAGRLLTDELWRQIEPLLPKPPPRRRRYPGRKRIEDRAVLTGILFVLKTRINWEDMPPEIGCGSGMTCLRRLREWQAAGAWSRVERVLRARMADANRIDWARAAEPPPKKAAARSKGRRSRTGPDRSQQAGRATRGPRRPAA